MALLLFSRTGINLRKGRGEILALYIPSIDQTQVYRDIGSTTAEVAQRSGSGDRTPLWREELGATVVYGPLPQDMAQIRQGLKVWLASDYAPADAEAFFFIFDRRWLVHGIQETDDEGRRKWRTTILSYPEDQIFGVVADNAADLMLGSNKRDIIIAVDEGLDSYSQLKELLAPLGLAPVPFSTLKPSAKARILYRHRDHMLAILVSLFFLSMAFIGTLVWWFSNSMELSRYEERVASVRQQISSIQINDSIGHIREPEALLNLMKRPFAQQPSAILDAASRLGAQFGNLSGVKFELQPEGAPSGQRRLMVEVTQPKQRLLVGQEALAKSLLPHLPWVRELANVSPPGSDRMDMDILLQIEAPTGAEVSIESPSPSEVILGEDGLPLGAVIPSLTEVVSPALVSTAEVLTSGTLPQAASVSASPVVVSSSQTFNPVSGSLPVAVQPEGGSR